MASRPASGGNRREMIYGSTVEYNTASCQLSCVKRDLVEVEAQSTQDMIVRHGSRYNKKWHRYIRGGIR